jgi:hypothetical protein
VAALANGAGGVIVVGVQDDGQGAARLAPFEGADAELEHRVRSVIADRVQPLPHFRTHVVSARSSGQGYLVVAVPRSGLAPHAVVEQDRLRYPARYGTQTVHMTESQVADRYRSRFALAQERVERLDQVMAEGTAVLDGAAPWVVLGFVPDQPGSVGIDADALSRLTEWAQRLPRTPIGNPAILDRSSPSVAFRRVRLGQSPDKRPPFAGSLIELHTDGAVFVARELWRSGEAVPSPSDTDVQAFVVADETIVHVVAAELRLACRYATDQAGVWGEAFVEVRVIGIRSPDARPLRVAQRGPGELVSVARHLTLAGDGTPSRRTIAIDAVAGGARDWLAATRLVANDLLQVFGVPETPHVGPTGSVRIGYFQPSLHDALRQWATQAGVAVE